MKLSEMKEEWRAINFCAGYEVSNVGRVRNARKQVLRSQVHYGRSKNVPYIRV